MKAITIRFGDSTFAEIKQEAQSQGQSTSAFIREAAFARAILLRARRGGVPADEYADLWQAARRVVESEDLGR